jgi:hypothetical protein
LTLLQRASSFSEGRAGKGISETGPPTRPRGPCLSFATEVYGQKEGRLPPSGKGAGLRACARQQKISPRLERSGRSRSPPAGSGPSSRTLPASVSGRVLAYGQIARRRVIARRGSLQAWLGSSGSCALLCARDARFCARDAFRPAFDGASFSPSGSAMPRGRRFPSPGSGRGSGRRQKRWIGRSSRGPPRKAQRVLSSFYLVTWLGV